VLTCGASGSQRRPSSSFGLGRSVGRSVYVGGRQGLVRSLLRSELARRPSLGRKEAPAEARAFPKKLMPRIIRLALKSWIVSFRAQKETLRRAGGFPSAFGTRMTPDNWGCHHASQMLVRTTNGSVLFKTLYVGDTVRLDMSSRRNTFALTYSTDPTRNGVLDGRGSP
jgi:hypothetical protein